MTPSGVEQDREAGVMPSCFRVIETMTPSGVEQVTPPVTRMVTSQVIETMTPSGVEQEQIARTLSETKSGDRDDDAFGR